MYVLSSGYKLAHFMRRIMFASQSTRFVLANIKQNFALDTVYCVFEASYADKCKENASL